MWDTHVNDENGNRILIPRKDLASFLTPYFWKALELYYLTENMECLPFSGGWAEQPAEVTEIINLFKIEQSKWEQEDYEKRRNRK